MEVEAPIVSEGLAFIGGEQTTAGNEVSTGLPLVLCPQNHSILSQNANLARTHENS